MGSDLEVDLHTLYFGHLLEPLHLQFPLHVHQRHLQFRLSFLEFQHFLVLYLDSLMQRVHLVYLHLEYLVEFWGILLLLSCFQPLQLLFEVDYHLLVFLVLGLHLSVQSLDSNGQLLYLVLILRDGFLEGYLLLF